MRPPARPGNAPVAHNRNSKRSVDASGVKCTSSLAINVRAAGSTVASMRYCGRAGHGGGYAPWMQAPAAGTDVVVAIVVGVVDGRVVGAVDRCDAEHAVAAAATATRATAARRERS